MKQLPEKWAIRTDDPEFYEWYNKNIKPSNWRDYTNVYSNLYLYSNNPDYLCSALLREGYEEITIEQWREAVKYGWKVKKQCGPECFCDGSCKDGKIDLDKCIESFNKHFGKLTEEQKDKLIAPYEQKELEETGELIGYEAPFDMYKGKYIEVKKGDILTKKDGGYTDKKELTFFPPEWVERDWKPRYKAKEKKREPKSGWVITKIEFLGDCYEFDIVPGKFTTQADCIKWVKEKGQEKVLYAYQEVDYITEE